MERESFEDAEVADMLNRHFISVKVDREERADIDAVYMNVTELLTGSGGWPMSVFMDWQKHPFLAGTYFPRHDGVYGPGFVTLLTRLINLWQGDRRRLVAASGEILSALGERERKKNVDYAGAIQKGFRQLRQRFDHKYGGFGHAPKFPSPHNLMLLMRYYHVHHDEQALQMAEKTLTSMALGGIYDHVGGGFSRYSTDERWLAPHFEKMLYDNALLAAAYIEAFLVTKNVFYRRVAEEIFQYAARDMLSAEGAFFSAEDADSEGSEGKFYTFTKREVLELLGAEDGERFCQAYDISEAGNFEGGNILNLIENKRYEEILYDGFYADCRKTLFAYRQKRVRPLRDDKILAGWNGLMIYALSYAARAFGSAAYLTMARSAADFILRNMLDADGKLLTRYRDGEARFCGVAEDYAFVIMGLIELYQAGFEVRYLSQAYRLNGILIDDFYENGALYQTAKEGEKLISRPRELHDGALPSYNSVSIGNFVRLAQLCDAPQLMEKAEGIVSFFGADIETAPFQFGFALCGMMLLNGASRQIVIAGEDGAKLADIVNAAYQPFGTLCFADGKLAEAFGFYQNFLEAGTRPGAYLCEGGRCEAPIYDADALRGRLGVKRME